MDTASHHTLPAAAARPRPRAPAARRRPARSPLRRGTWLGLVLAVLLPGALLAAEVTYLVRPAQVLRAGTAEWVRLDAGDEVAEGDRIRTGSGARVEVTLDDKRVIRIGSASEVALDELVLRDAGLRTKLRVLLGRMWTGMLAPLRRARDEHYAVETPTATVGIKGTQFDVQFEAEAEVMQTLVVEGEVEVRRAAEMPGPPREVPGPREVAPPQEITREQWTRLVTANQKLVFVPGEPPRVEPLTDEDLAEEWVQFNLQRDAELRQRAGAPTP